MKVLLFLVTAALLFSCHSGADKNITVAKAAVIATPNKLLNEARKRVSVFPEEIEYPAKILTIAGVFHNDEVDPKWAYYNWQGIFKADSDYYASKTEVKIKHAHDDVMDEGPAKTGWEVKTSIKDSAILLVSGIDNLPAQKIKRIAITKTQLLPGESEDFMCNGNKYTLFALGSKTTESPGRGSFLVNNYKLFLRTKKNGVEYNQIMVSVNGEKDTFAVIMFVGDVDGDGAPDFILDTTHQENSEVQTLYLSKPAGKNSLLKVIGTHPIVGC